MYFLFVERKTKIAKNSIFFLFGQPIFEVFITFGKQKKMQ